MPAPPEGGGGGGERAAVGAAPWVRVCGAWTPGCVCGGGVGGAHPPTATATLSVLVPNSHPAVGVCSTVSAQLYRITASRGGNVREGLRYKLKIFPPGKMTFYGLRPTWLLPGNRFACLPACWRPRGLLSRGNAAHAWNRRILLRAPSSLGSQLDLSLESSGLDRPLLLFPHSSHIYI